MFETVRRLILSMCRTEVYGNSVTATSTANPLFNEVDKCDSTGGDTECIIDPTSGWANQQRKGRLLPIPEIGGDTGTWDDGVDRNDVAFIPPFENTKHRYPWICSLRYVISKVLNSIH